LASTSSSSALPDLGKEKKKGGFRLLIAFHSDRAVFLFGVAKSERENIDDAEMTTLRDIIRSLLAASAEKIAQALKDGTLIEVPCEKSKDEG
jgi:hypothetical protein